MAKDHTRSSRVELRGHDHHPVCAQGFEATLRVIHFSESREAFYRTHRNSRRLPQLVYILLRNPHERLVVEYLPSFSVQKNVRRDTLMKQFQGSRGANFGLAGEGYNRVRLLRLIHYQKASRLAGGRQQQEQQD
jgi:hypothetical protein